MTICRIRGCEKEAKVKGLCNAHYLHNRRYGTPYTKTTKQGLIKEHPNEYNSYRSMKSRCFCKTDKSYPRWGGRGITVCTRWLGAKGFENFLSDMGERPAGCSLDRKDVDGCYCPENCRWATVWEQASNTRTRHNRTPGVYFIKERGKWCANFKIGDTRLTRSCATIDDAIVQRKQWEDKYIGKKKESA